MAYDLIVADPPWAYTFARSNNRQIPYQTERVCSLTELAPNTNENAMLLLWATGPKMPEALELMTSWGFRYVTVLFVWVKTSKSKPDKPVNGMGYYSRSNCEFVLLGVKGKGHRRLVASHSVSQVFYGPRREHSRKPDEFWAKLRELFNLEGLRCLEMFSREARPGFDQMGNQTEFFTAAHDQ